VVLLASQGLANHAIAQQTGLSRPTVIAIRRDFARAGVEGIRRPQKRKKPSPILTPELQQKILDTTLKTKPAGETHWTVRILARHLGISRTMVHRVWQRFDIQPGREV
jgi:transposase